MHSAEHVEVLSSMGFWEFILQILWNIYISILPVHVYSSSMVDVNEANEEDENDITP